METILTEKEINKMTPIEMQIQLDILEDLMCNTDYMTPDGEILYSIYAASANNIINKQNKEY